MKDGDFGLSFVCKWDVVDELAGAFGGGLRKYHQLRQRYGFGREYT